MVAGGGTISASGLFTAGTVPGAFPNTVQASAGGSVGQASVTVIPGPLATIVVSPNPDSLPVGGTQQFTAVGKDAAGNVVPVTPTWSVVAGGGAISATGLFTAGVTPGTYVNTVRAASGDIAGTATVTVTSGTLAAITVTPNPVTLPIRGTQAFTAVGTDAGGNVVSITPVWSVVAGGGAIDGAGLFTAGVVPGTYANTVQASSGGISGRATVTVTVGTVASITVTPNPVTLPISGTQQFTAVGRDAGGNIVAMTPTWNIVAGGGTINAAGLFTAGTLPGTFTNTIVASSGGISGTATVTVTTGALASISVTPANDTLPINGTQTYVAVGRDAGGNVVAITPSWSVVAGGGVIDGAGVFTAGTLLGTFTNTVTATSGGITATATVTVRSGALATITVTPVTVTLPISGTQQYTAVGKDAGGNVVPIVPVWTVVAGGGAISGTGLFTAGVVPGTFTNTVQVSSGGVIATATVTVTTGALAAIALTPDPTTLAINGTQQFTAVGTDAGGNVVAITPTWTVVAGGGAISGAGLFTAGSVPGTFTNTVTATSGGVTGTATVTVTTGTLATITVTPNPVTLPINGTQTFTAVGRDAGGNVVALAPTWSVVAGGGVITGAGQFTAGTVPGTYANTISATSGGITGTATVTITTGVLTTITVSPSAVTLPTSGTQQFTAVGRDAGGNVVSVSPAWTVVAGGGSIGAAGLFTAGMSPGTFTNTVQATSGGVTGSATVTVITGALTTITVTPNPVTLAINGAQQFTAVGTDVGGNVITLAPIWSVAAGGGVISGAGLFTAGTVPGTYTNTVTATSGGVTGTATVTITTGPVATITVTPNPVTLPITGTQAFTAVGRDAGGNVVAIAPVWTVVAGGGAISGAGLFTAGTVPGTFTNTVTASSGGVSGSATVTVTTGALSTITVTPNPVSLPISATQQFTAVGRDAGGNVVAIAPAWSIVAGGGTVDGAGLFTAGTVPGTFANTVTATSGSVSGAATVTVTVTTGALATITVTPNPVSLAISGTQQFTVVGRDAGGNVVSVSPTWSVVASGGTITGAGLFTAGTAPGTFSNTVRATSGAVSGSATVTVTTGPLATITVSPNPVSLVITGTQQFTAVGRDAGGNIVALSPMWSVVAGGGAISGAGMFTAGTAPGTFTNTVQATSGSITGNATVTVTTGAVATITVSPNPVTLAINGTQLFSAVGRDAGGNVVTISPVWTVVAGGGTISGAGLFTAATAPGTYTNTVQASSGIVFGTATVTVTTGALTTITVSPNPVTLPITGTQQFTAVGTDAGGNVVALSPTWSVAAGGGTINGAGLFTAGTVPGTYTNTATATSGSISGSATVTVVPGALASITVTPNPVTLPITGTQQFTAVGTDASGNVVAITPTWSVVAGGGAINGSGFFAAGTTAGTYTNTVTATSGSITGTATVTVTTGPLATITISPNPGSMVTNGSQQFSAVGTDASGNVLAISVTWSVVAGGGTISGTGLFTAGFTAGTFTNTVRAASGSITGSATVIVSAAPPAGPSLGAAASNGIVAASTITCVGTGTVGGDISVSPGTAIAGFPPCVVAGTKHAADAAALAAQSAVGSASDALAAMACTTTITADLGGTTLLPGVYCGGAVGVSGIVTLNGNGNSNAIFVIRASSTLTTAGSVVLQNGAQAQNVFWWVGSSATLGAGSAWAGNIIAQVSITLNDGTSLSGRALARSGAVTLGSGNTISLP